MKYQSRECSKDIPDDQEKLLTLIINRNDGYDKGKKKDLHNEKNAASTLMNRMSNERGEQSNDKEAWNQLDDDNNCEAVAKKQITTFIMTGTV